MRILIVQGSPRSKFSCSGGTPKTKLLVKEAVEELESKGSVVDVVDLRILDGISKVQPCKGCISTANGFQCTYPCSCYSAGDKENPDFMHDNNIYQKFELAGLILVFTPINWYTVTTQVKAFFDRLVCCNLTLTTDKAKELFGDGFKNSIISAKAEQSGLYNHLLLNHYEGKVCGIFGHGDLGADDYKNRKIPLSMQNNAIKDEEFDEKIGLMPLALQMRYSGIFCPDELIQFHVFGANKPYSVSDKDALTGKEFLLKARDFANTALKYVQDLNSRNR